MGRSISLVSENQPYSADWGPVPRGVGGDGGSSRGGTNGTSCCRTAAEPAQPITVTVCAGRWGGGGCAGGSGGGAGLSGERPARELAEWRSQGSELAEWRSQVRELAESAAGCRTVKSGCRTVPAQAVHIPIGGLWISHWKGLQPSGCIAWLSVLHACVVSASQGCVRECHRHRVSPHGWLLSGAMGGGEMANGAQ